MNRVIALADRSAMPALKLLAAANVLFLLSFAVMLALATGEARGEIPACKGVDMLAAIERNDPALLARIRAEAAATLNGDALLWKLEKPGREPSFLFGTMHMTDPRVTSLTPAAERAFDASQTVVIETTEILDPAKMLTGMMKKPELTMFTDGTTLASHMSPEDAEAVEKALDKRGIPPATVAQMKPWMLSAMLALPACELARKAAGAPVLDVKLAEDAKATGKRLEGLETVTDQFEAMASLPIEFHIQGLIDTLKLGDKTDDVIETMIVLYESGQIGMYWPLFRAVLPGGDGEDVGYAAFEEAMVTARNRNMAAKAAPILDDGNAFIAVGALHLPGPNGLVELLRRDGYAVSAVR